MGAPVDHTCPKIREVSEKIEDISIKLEKIKDIFEVVRSSNDALRRWGYELEAENKQLKL